MAQESEQLRRTTEEGGVQLRNTSKLFVSLETLRCSLGCDDKAMKKILLHSKGEDTDSERHDWISFVPTRLPCIACAYKVATFDVALDKEFTKQVANVRPEMCPRLKERQHAPLQQQLHVPNLEAFGYFPGMSILTVGDGDFSFSLALARSLFRRGREVPKMKSIVDNKQAKSANAVKQGTQAESRSPAPTTLIATSYESLEQLRSIYEPQSLEATLNELREIGAQVHFETDATNIHETLSPIREGGINLLFHRIVWNFPCSAIDGGQDGQNAQMEYNKSLVRQFMKEASSLLHPADGEVHMTHKTKPPYDQWKLEQVALEPWTCQNKVIIRESSAESKTKRSTYESCNTRQFVYSGRIVFDRCCFWPYVPRKAKDKKSFPCHDACIFVFQHAGEKERIAQPTFPPTLPSIHAIDIPMNKGLEQDILPVSNDLILLIRETHLSARDCGPSKKRKVHGRKRTGKRSKGC